MAEGLTAQGKRVDATPGGPDDYPFPRLKSGEYGKDVNGLWYCVPPGRDPFSFMGTLGDGSGVKCHTVIEHEDGTITVTPSILISSHEGSWHGYLKRGVWEEIV